MMGATGRLPRSALLLCFSLACTTCLEVAAAGIGTVVVDDIRVQVLSPRVLRVEPRGPAGFEDRTTFMVVDRNFPILATSSKQTTSGTEVHTDFYTVVLSGKLQSGCPSFRVFDGAGKDVYDSSKAEPTSKLHWPAPLTQKAYAIADSPRFSTPEWALSPAPVGLRGYSDTNGFDFENDVWCDTYVFLVGDSLESWQEAREDFLKLTGPVPTLPDYAYGTWFTFWHDYTEFEAKKEVERWDKDRIPLDIWGLDMEWRHVADNQDRAYDHPNTTAFFDFSEWFTFLHARGLHTYFNDHPYPSAKQTSRQEVNFRWNALTRWMMKGLDFWWFDHNWKFSIPPPNVEDSTGLESNWRGLNGVAWGSYVYFSIAERYNKMHGRSRTMVLSKYAIPDAKSGMDPMLHAESPAHHRYPVWWTGDYVSLQASVEVMVDAGVHDFKPFVHSDCGGDDWNPSAGALVRWTAHCALGNILRFHGGPHQPWTSGSSWEKDIRKYVDLRYMLMPTIIAAGHRATENGLPLVARCDLYWPNLAAQASSNLQYIFVDDLLVAPITNTEHNMTSRQVWIPPGHWEDAWTGEIVSGPKVVRTTQPFERVPLWHRADGGLVVMTAKSAPRVARLDWSVLTIEAWPCIAQTCKTGRSLYERGSDSARTDITLETNTSGIVHLRIGEGTQRAWVVRFHLRAGQRASHVTVNGGWTVVRHLEPRWTDDGTPWQGYFPLRGPGEEPASNSGPVVEIRVARGPAKVELSLSGPGLPLPVLPAVQVLTDEIHAPSLGRITSPVGLLTGIGTLIGITASGLVITRLRSWRYYNSLPDVDVPNQRQRAMAASCE